jgi:DNA polymerase III subunit chi
VTERIDFYVLPGAGERDRLLLACRLTEKAYGLDHRVYIHAADEHQARQLDELLWTFKQHSFVPHARYPVAADETAPVLIGVDAEPDCAAEVLINLADEVPAGYARFQRIAELVDQQPAVLEASRARFRFYREQGLEPHSHKLPAVA